jgi:hypothetical protein
MWRGAVIFNEPHIKASPDQTCHVCVVGQRSSIIPYYLPLCVFVPQPTS